MSTPDLDDLDRKIIVALENDGRRSFRDMGRALDVPEATIRLRVNRLLENGFIRIAAVGNLFSLGVEVVAVTLLRVQPGKVKDAAQRLADYPHVRFVGTSFGDADIVIQTLHTSVRELHQFIAEVLPSEVSGIVSTQTYQLAEVVKSSWNWSEWFNREDEKDKAPVATD